ncbi:MAG: AMP-binding protein [Phycisphaerales bacterium]|nr:AMP-binding protein [Phycisphaerales bacterium]
MQVLRPILRRLLTAPLSVRAIDDQRSWRGVDLYVAALHLARELERVSDRPRVGFMLPTSGLCPVAIIAGWLLGRTVVPLNYLLKPDDLAYVLADAEVDAVVTVGPMLEHFGDLPEGVRAVKLDEMRFGGVPPLRRMPRRADDHLAVLLYTSGTSGRPKGVMLTSGNLAANVQQCIEFAGFSRQDRLLGVLPQFHSFGLTVLTLLPLTSGSLVVYTARFLPKRILNLLKKHRPTAVIAIPSMYNALLSAKSAEREHFESLKWVVSGGEPLPAAVFEGFRERFGVTINEGYGLTETAPVTNWCRPEDHRLRSVGPPLPRVDEKVVDAEGRELATGEEGEICIKGPNVMPGYFNLPEETARVFDSDGYFRTGDMGRFDGDRHLFITGRIKEMLIIGGENVFPREIEEALIRHPSVHDAAVIGVADESRGEVPLAFVELEEGAAFDEAALRAHCREHIAQYKVPREIRPIEALPRNPTGKILRRELSVDTAATVPDAGA